MSLVNPFAPKPRDVLSDVARIKTLVRAMFGLGEDGGVTVSQIACRDPACPGIETVVLILPARGPTRLLKVPGPMAGVTEEALARAGAAVDGGAI